MGGDSSAFQGGAGQLRIYLAAQTRRRTELEKVARSLEAAGHVIVSSWVFKDDEHLDRKTIAKRDLEQVIAADCVVLFTEPRGNPGKEHGGRHVEFAFGLARNKKLFIIGEPENVFQHLDCVTCLDSVAELIEHLDKHKNKRRMVA